MEMGDGSSMSGPACKISMLWNWYAIDSCFLASSWHVRSKGGFAGSVIGVFLLVIALEFVRRMQREYDRLIVRQSQYGLVAVTGGKTASRTSSEQEAGPHVAASLRSTGKLLRPLAFRPTVIQHAIRSLFYMVQFVVAYFVMLLAMYYNGYIIIAISLGAGVGHFIFGWDNIIAGGRQETGTSCC